MKVEVISWKFETSLLLLEYKANEQLRRQRALIDDFKNRVLLDYSSTGISESNFLAAIKGEDVKHKITSEMIEKFIVWFHNI